MAQAFIGEDADGEAVIVTCRCGDAADTHGKVYAAFKASDLKADSLKCGWFRFNVPPDMSMRDAKKIVRHALISQGIEVS